MAKTKKGPAKKAGKKPGKRTPKPMYAKAKAEAKTGMAEARVSDSDAIKWLLIQAQAHGWGAPE